MNELLDHILELLSIRRSHPWEVHSQPYNPLWNCRTLHSTPKGNKPHHPRFYPDSRQKARGRPLYLQLDDLLEGLWELSTNYHFILAAKLSGLTKITLNGKIDSSWNKLPETFRQAFVPFLRAQVQDVCISSITSFPLSSLNGCKNLRTVTLEEMWYDKGSRMDPESTVSVNRTSCFSAFWWNEHGTYY